MVINTAVVQETARVFWQMLSEEYEMVADKTANRAGAVVLCKANKIKIRLGIPPNTSDTTKKTEMVVDLEVRFEGLHTGFHTRRVV